MITEPYLFEGVSVHNPITDLLNHLFFDINRLSKSLTEEQLTQIKYDKTQEFGDIFSD